MRNITAYRKSLTKTLAITIAAVGMATLPVGVAQADDTRPAPAPTQRSTQLADAPLEPVRSCSDFATEIFYEFGWYEAAAHYIDCITSPHHPENTDDDDAPATAPLAPTTLSDAFREPSRSCYDYAYDIYITSGWYEAASAYLDCWQNPNHPDNDDDKP